MRQFVAFPMIRLSQVTKAYQSGSILLPVLRGVDLHVEGGEFIAIMGQSGSGKSTLLNILGLLDRYDGGSYSLNGKLLKDLSENEAAHYRGRMIGFIFQAFNLLAFKTALENVALPLYYQRIARQERENRARVLLERMGLGDRLSHLPAELSGGQRQRVAIARALANDPQIILADEPTGNLDTATSREVMAILSEINHEGTTLVVVTHDEVVANLAHRIICLQDGMIVAATRIH